MKKFLMFLCAIFVDTAFAEAVNVTWMNGDSVYDTSTCTVGGDFNLPSVPPTKTGYTFRGWGNGIISGTWNQSGTQSPTNPIEPVFDHIGTAALRAIKYSDTIVADSYDPATGIFTHRIAVKIFDGTEDWIGNGAGTEKSRFSLSSVFSDAATQNGCYITHFRNVYYGGAVDSMGIGAFFQPEYKRIFIVVPKTIASSVDEFKSWLATQYANGTPVTVYYQLKISVEEPWGTATQQ